MRRQQVYRISTPGIPTGALLRMIFLPDGIEGVENLLYLIREGVVRAEIDTVGHLQTVKFMKKWVSNDRMFSVFTTGNFDLALFADSLAWSLECLQVIRPEHIRS